MTCCTSEQSAENVSSACVGSGNAIAYHECGASDVVGDNTEGNVGLFIFLIIYACNAADVLHYVLNGIYLEEVVNALHSAGKTLKAHTCINVLVSHFSVVAVSVAVELGEYQVPYLDNSVAVACLLKALKGAVFLASVEVDLGAGTAGAAAVLPEVISLAKTDNSLLGNADVVHPDALSLVIALKNGYPQSVSGDCKHACEELPSPCDSFLLEVVAEGEVAEHFKISTVAGSLTYTLDIGGTDTLLAGSYTHIGRCFCAEEEFLRGAIPLLMSRRLLSP